MAILDVGLLSGFRPPPGAAAPTHLIRKVEILPEKVSLYLDSVRFTNCSRIQELDNEVQYFNHHPSCLQLNKSEVCVRLPVVRVYKMSHVRDVVVQVYDYYEPSRYLMTSYDKPMRK